MSLPLLTPRARAVVSRYAVRRGIPDNKLHEFLYPKLDPGRHELPHAEKAAARLQEAVVKNERIVIFGDYDADGISSVAILLRFFAECSSLQPAWKLPNRQLDHYGLEIEMARKIVAEFQPTLLIAIDCGTNSAEAVSWLRQHGIDTIIIDHHPLLKLANDALAVINPKAHEAAPSGELTTLSAAGLAFLFCHHLARTWNCVHQWDHITATMIAGLGTLGDAVPLSPINRAIIKTAINYFNSPTALGRCAGLKAIVPTDGARISQRRIQFEIVPPLNALGRLGAADPSVRLLITNDPVEAARIASDCRESNDQRKVIQQKIVAQAVEQGRALIVEHPALSVLILAASNWLPGVVGPSASRVAEQLGRSAILLGPDQGPDQWKGSGRAVNGDHLGNWIEAVKQKGLVERGGGHAAAVGVAIHTGQIQQLRAAANALPMSQVADHEPESEVVGELDELPAEEWLQVCEALEPCGRGNPAPLVSARNALLIQAPTELRLHESGEVWAWKGNFSVGGQTISVVWRDIERAVAHWRQGRYYDLQLELSPEEYNGRTYFNWLVIRCEPTA